MAQHPVPGAAPGGGRAEAGEPLVDRGQATTNLEASVRQDEAYSPEKGPIRYGGRRWLR